MREVYPNLYCGNDQDWLNLEKEFINSTFVDQPTQNWAVAHAAKEPNHRQFVGYTGRGCPKESSEYLWAERGNRLALNIVDAPKPEFFAKEMIDKALDFIDEKLKAGYKVLVHCNQGESRSPSIVLLYLIKKGIIIDETLEDCEAEFMKIYPEYNPGAGIRGFLKEHWREYKDAR
jgi:predicted protein tyrosine phosphatase